MLQVAKTVREVSSDDQVQGVVVTHGTDTMEETAYLCDLCHTGSQPVVFTGAQHHADTPDADGPRNLADAIRIARCEAAKGAGALIAMAGRIDAAREATKMHTFAPQTFASFEHGKLGQVHAGAVSSLPADNGRRALTDSKPSTPTW
jgi:L-asparaginase